jgi:hypothetical protein
MKKPVILALLKTEANGTIIWFRSLINKFPNLNFNDSKKTHKSQPFRRLTWSTQGLRGSVGTDNPSYHVRSEVSPADVPRWDQLTMEIVSAGQSTKTRKPATRTTFTPDVHRILRIPQVPRRGCLSPSGQLSWYLISHSSRS